MNILVTGAAGFIGFHLSRTLCGLGHTVTGIDNLNGYYDVNLKKARLEKLKEYPEFRFELMDLTDLAALRPLFEQGGFSVVLHMAAQAGVRYSLENPQAYIQSNLLGFGNLLECCRQEKTGNLIYASSSSVYGMNGKLPFSERDPVDHPVSLYAATKKSNELMAHAYSHLYGIPTTGLRFFTVYGPWGRPDMALYIFTRAILDGRPIPLFNQGRMSRDFTYIDDIVEGVIALIHKPARPDASFDDAFSRADRSSAPYRIFNIGNNRPEELDSVISLLEKYLGIPAKRELLPMQPGDVVTTFADIDALHKETGYAPKTSIEEGIRRFIVWYKSYYSPAPYVVRKEEPAGGAFSF